jgi:hypothetical protein
MIELLIAALVALCAASAAAQLITNLTQSGFNRRSAATSAIEVSITNDLSWFRQFAVLWRMKQGPYSNLPIAITGDFAPPVYTQSAPTAYYTPNSQECTTDAMALSFRQAVSNPLSYTSPLAPPPNQVLDSASEQNVSLPSSASEYSLYRTLEAGTIPGTLKITYTLKNSAGTTVFDRPSTLYLPAAGWCS